MSVILDHVIYSKKKLVVMRNFHAHPYLEIYYLKDGARFYTTEDGKIIKLYAGDFLFIPPHESHLMKGPVVDNYNLKIDIDDIPEQLLPAIYKCTYQFDTISIPREKRKYFENELEEIHKEFLKSDKYDTQMLHCMSVSLLVDIVRFALEEITPFDEKKDDSFEKTLSYINENYKKQLSIDSLAAMANMSKSYFSHTFKDRLGTTPIEYINNLKVNAASKYILEGNYSTSEIAQKAGFKNVSYFCSTFKKYTGFTANEYKALYSVQLNNDDILNPIL